MKNKKLVWAAAILLVIFTAAFRISKQPETVTITIPSNFPPPVYNLANNPVTQKGFELGRKLFYEPLLSRDSSISCGSCHQQESAFIQAGHDFSHGVDNKHGRRNSLPVFNALFKKTFFWDGGVHNLDFVPVNAIENRLEMDEKLDNVLNKLNGNIKYRSLFKEAFGSDSITTKHFLQSLAQFMAAMISANSRYDKFIRNEGEQLTRDELDGLRLFKLHCSTCHATDLFTDGSYRNNGITSDFRFDKGREAITLNQTDRGKFKVPSLRNVAYTAPYMHNGSLETLEEVLTHYTSGIKESPTLDSLFKLRPGPPAIPLTELEKNNIIAFLKTLTDLEFIKDKRFSEYH